MKTDNNKQQELPSEPFDDSHLPDFSPYLRSRIGEEEEDDDDEEDLSYDGFLRY